MSTETFEHEGLLIRMTYDADRVTVRCEGTSDARDPHHFLGPTLKRLVERTKDKSVTVDLSALRYMNSASVAPLINLMKDLHASGVPTVFLWNTQVSWQRANFICMKTIARTFQGIAVEAVT